MKTGDLIRFKVTGKFATIIKEMYVKRFMDAEDREMEAHGMGHLAGVYANAIDVMDTDTGRKSTVRLRHPRHFEIVSESG